MTHKNKKFTTEQFLKDVENHQMKVLHNVDGFRHLEFSKGSFEHRFCLTTWPGHLCVSGDMGCYVFSRLSDMFDFFRKSTPDYAYWAQKVQAQDRNAPVKEFSKEAFKETVEDIRDNIIESYKIECGYDDEEESVKKFVRQFDLMIKNLAWENVDSYEAAREFMEDYIEYKDTDLKIYFQDFWTDSYSCEEFSYWFTWCCNAIPWGISKFEEAVK